MTSHRRSRAARPRLPLSFEPLEDRLAPATFTVNTNLDDDTPGNGLVSLREAIDKANALAGPDVIRFDVGGGGHQTIDLLAPLPVIRDPVRILGQTQPGFDTTTFRPLIELNGEGAGPEADGLLVRANGAGSVIRGLVINRFADHGVLLVRTSVTVRGCFIGTDATGTTAQGNGTGINIGGSHFVTGAGSVIGGATAGAGNVISGNLGDGVLLDSGGTGGMVIQGNLIGSDFTGTLDLGNGGAGVHLFWGSSNNLIGGTTAGAGNVISGNGGHGVMMEGFFFPRGGDASTIGNRVEGNFIGTNSDGIDLGNDGDGVALLEFTRANVVGGTAPGARNVISGNAGDGVRLSGRGNTLNRVEGNFIGTNPAGDAPLQNEAGVIVEEGARNAVIGGSTAGARNVISGNAGDGIALVGTTGVVVRGNFIGANAAGTGPLGNGGAGVSLTDSANGNLIGGTAAGSRNVISANANGVVVEGSSANRVQGNRIGTDRTGTAILGNAGGGVVVREPATRNVIGGTAAGAGNVISGNGAHGVLLEGPDTALNRVRGNFIGTDRAGTTKLGNTGGGVAVRGGAHDNAIGGTSPGSGNVISGNVGSGVLLEGPGTAGNLVQGNLVGTNPAGTDLGNAAHGLFITDAAGGNSVGGTADGAGNVIAFNGDDGVLVGSDPGRGFDDPAGTGNRINRNRIFDNFGQGIDLGPNDGLTSNDPLDPDTGPNRLQNFPELYSVLLTPGGVHVEGTIDTEPNRTYRIEFFWNPSAGGSGSAEGRRYLGFVTVNSDPDGRAEFKVDFLAAGILEGHAITATATFEFGNTSEFSPATPVESPP
jgi:hypothetical protein